jgi:type II secretory ATPase GspE/PulE/Tfp pilus assembly ATPase PilB-like protein
MSLYHRILVPCGFSCHRQGYAGRVGVYEVATIGQPAIADGITQGVSESALRALLRKHGTASLRHDALLKAAAGTTSFSEVNEAFLA